jgi:shikimate kinase / 3-dehydroquinate synthase
MDVVMVGLPGSGKSVVGRRLAGRHGAQFIDLDERIETADGRSIPDIFEEDGEAAFRSLERTAIADLGSPDGAAGIRRVISTGGGAVVDPRNRWALFRGRRSVWLDGRPEVLAQRLRRSPHVRPLVSGRDPIGTIRELGARRQRFYAAAEIHQSGIAEVHGVLDAVDERLTTTIGGATASTMLLRATTPIGRYVVGDGIAVDVLAAELERLSASRTMIVSEPMVWKLHGERLTDGLHRHGIEVDHVLVPEGESAKRLSVIDDAARELATRHVERSDVLVALGGGALGDTAGFLAAVYLRGLRIIQVPTTMVAQIDASIGGKTGVDLPEGKNLVGAFHQPEATIVDLAFLPTLPKRQLAAALGEAVKMAVLGDGRLFELLESDGWAIATGATEAFERGVVAEVVERAGWAKLEVVGADEREQGAGTGRITLNLGHSLGHAFEAAAGYDKLLHGEAVAYGLRAATRIGLEVGVTPPDRAARIEHLIDAVGLAGAPLPYSIDVVMDHLAHDKKRVAGRQRWVLPTADGVAVRDDIDPMLVKRIATGILGEPARSPS